MAFSVYGASLITLFVAWGITRNRVIGFAVLWPVAAIGADLLGESWVQTVLISRYAPFFAAGMLMYLIHRDGHTKLLWTLVAANTVTEDTGAYTVYAGVDTTLTYPGEGYLVVEEGKKATVSEWNGIVGNQGYVKYTGNTVVTEAPTD